MMERAVTSLCEGAMARDRVVSWLSEREYPVNVGVHQGLVLSQLLYKIVVDMVTEDARDGLKKFLYMNALILKSETIENLQEKFLKWKEAFESKGRTVNLERQK